ncbi:MAG: FHA domain-containing protein [Thermoguttaceae bacterium]|jgi:pSer/pThr/pTyr-binding forkhead associated (FHA) protein
MFTWISSTYHLIFALSGRIWRPTKKFLGNGLPLPSTKQALLVMKTELIPVGPLAAKGNLVIDTLPAVLGRNEQADVRLDDHWVSRVHCELSDLDGTLVVRDLGSKHGTYVNGQKATQAPLLPGDRLTVGLSSFEVQCEQRRTKPSLPEVTLMSDPA